MSLNYYRDQVLIQEQANEASAKMSFLQKTIHIRNMMLKNNMAKLSHQQLVMALAANKVAYDHIRSIRTKRDQLVGHNDIA